MPSRKLVSGKHPIIVRVTELEYRDIKRAAYEHDLSANEWMALCANKMTADYLLGKGRK